MSVRFRKDRKKWEAERMINGKRIRSLHETKKEAQKADFFLRSQKLQFAGIRSRYPINETFASFLKTDSAQKSARTQKVHLNFLHDVEQFWIEQNVRFLDQVNLETMQILQNHIAKTKAWRPSTAFGRLKILKTIFRKAFSMGHIQRDPTEFWKVPRGTSRRRRPMSHEEFSKLFQTEMPAWFRPVLLFLRLTGARGESCAGLRWSDIDFSKAIVYLRSRKGGVEMEKTISFPMYTALFQLLAKERNLKPNASQDDFVFCDDSGNPLQGRRISSLGYQIIRKAGLTGLVLYSMRHALAVDLTEEGVNLEITRQVMGHSSIAQTQTYAQGISQNTLRESMKKIRGDNTPPDHNDNTNLLPMRKVKSLK